MFIFDISLDISMYSNICDISWWFILVLICILFISYKCIESTFNLGLNYYNQHIILRVFISVQNGPYKMASWTGFPNYCSSIKTMKRKRLTLYSLGDWWCPMERRLSWKVTGEESYLDIWRLHRSSHMTQTRWTFHPYTQGVIQKLLRFSLEDWSTRWSS